MKFALSALPAFLLLPLLAQTAFALPVNVAIVLTSVYILSVGLQAAASRAAGGG